MGTDQLCALWNPNMQYDAALESRRCGSWADFHEVAQGIEIEFNRRLDL